MEQLEAAAKRVMRAKEFGPVVDIVISHIEKLGVLGSALYRVSPDYYNLSLRSRAAQLDCDVEQLCKTLVFENVHPSSRPPEGSPPQLYAVVLQYVARLDVEALEKSIRARYFGGISVKLRAAEGVHELTGFAFNAVTIFGSRCAMRVFVAKPVSLLPFVWLGGGEPDVKLRMFTSQLLRPDVLSAAVLDCTELRDDGEDEDDSALLSNA